jgi:hypothetical protein
VLWLAAAACGPGAPESGREVTPVYNKQSGRLEALVSDRDGDGRADTRAVMDGTAVTRIEIDRNGDGKPDRWEFYASAAAGATPVMERAEESDAADGRITRREFFEGGAIVRAEEDTDRDGRVDKWETYTGGSVVTLELDLAGRGRPTQRLTYGAGGGVTRVESDPDGDGVFAPLTPGGKS